MLGTRGWTQPGEPLHHSAHAGTSVGEVGEIASNSARTAAVCSPSTGTGPIRGSCPVVSTRGERFDDPQRSADRPQAAALVVLSLWA